MSGPSPFPFPCDDGALIAIPSHANLLEPKTKRTACATKSLKTRGLKNGLGSVPDPFNQASDHQVILGLHPHLLCYPPAPVFDPSLVRDKQPLVAKTCVAPSALGPATAWLAAPSRLEPKRLPPPPKEDPETIRLRKKKESLRRLPTVQSLNLYRFSGTWYEVARLPNPMETECVRNAKAEYAFCQGSNEMGMLNSCITKDGSLDVFNAVAVPVAPGKLWVRPDGSPAPRRSETERGNYWVVHVDPQYTEAIVVSPEAASAWFLTRYPCTPANVTDRLVARLGSAGVDVCDVIVNSNYVLDASRFLTIAAASSTKADASDKDSLKKAANAADEADGACDEYGAGDSNGDGAAKEILLIVVPPQRKDDKNTADEDDRWWEDNTNNDCVDDIKPKDVQRERRNVRFCQDGIESSPVPWRMGGFAFV